MSSFPPLSPWPCVRGVAPIPPIRAAHKLLSSSTPRPGPSGHIHASQGWDFKKKQNFQNWKCELLWIKMFSMKNFRKCLFPTIHKSRLRGEHQNLTHNLQQIHVIPHLICVVLRRACRSLARSNCSKNRSSRDFTSPGVVNNTSPWQRNRLELEIILRFNKKGRLMLGKIWKPK